MEAHRPSIAGCAVGFGVAGTGVGSLVGLWMGSVSQSAAMRLAETPAERETVLRFGLLFTCAGVHTGLLLGLVAGAFAGIAYAVYKRLPDAEASK